MTNTTSETPINQITEGIIWKQLLIFFFPIVLGTFFQQLYNTADAIVVGRFVGKEALASVGGSANQITNLIVGFFMSLSSGASVVISQYYGAKNTDRLQRTLHTGVAFAVIGGIIISVVGYVFTPFLLNIMKTPQALMESSTTYLRIYFAGAVFVCLYNICAGIQRAVGDSKRPLYFLIVCCFINIVLDILFVLVFKMGVAGVAVATLIAQAISAMLTLITLMRSSDIYQLYVKKIHLHSESLKIIVRLGIPAGLQAIMYNLSNMIIQTSFNTLGTDTVAAWTAFGKVDAIFWMVTSAFGIAITTFVGQNYGAGNYLRIKRSVRICLFMALGFAVFMSIFFLITGRTLFHLFTDDPSVIAIGVTMIMFIAPAYGLYSFIEIYSGALRGTGDVIIPTIMTGCGICVFRVIWILVATPISPEIETIILSYPLSWGITAILFICYYHKRQKQFS